MRTWAIRYVALMSVGACNTPTSYPPMTPVEWGAGICDTISNSQRCAQEVERVKVAAAGNTVIAKHDTLCFQGRGWHGCLARAMGHPDYLGEAAYIGTMKHPWAHVLWVQYSEGSDVRLVDAQTGTVSVVDNNPVPSPDGSRVAVANGDLEAQYGPNRLTVWRWNAGQLQQEWKIEPADWEPQSVEWVDDLHLRVQRSWPFSSTPSIDTVNVLYIDGTWQLRQ